MSTWIIPYVDQHPALWDEITDRFGRAVKEVYFPVPGRRFASGRGPQPEKMLLDFLAKSPLTKAVLINPIVLPRPVEEMAPEILYTLHWLRDEYGIRSVTVTQPLLAREIKNALPELFVTASVLMGVGNPLQLQMLGGWFDAITADNRLVRDLSGLQSLRAAFPGELRLIVNEACLPGCPYRVQHFYEMGYCNGNPRSLCQPVLEANPWLRLTGSWILPRHLHYFDGLVDGLKLAGRVTLRDPERYKQVLDAYIHRLPLLPRDLGGGPASPLDGTDVSDEWFAHVLRCDKRCDICVVCRDQYEKRRGVERG